MNKKGNGMGLSQEVLLREAARLAPVLRALRAAKPDISSDALWQGILSQWSEKDLEKALVAFEKSKSLTRFKKLLSPLPQAGPDGFFEAEGEKWGTREVLAKLLGLSRPTIHTHSTHCRMLRGKDVAGHTLKFYAVSDIRKACERLLEHLPKAGSSGFIEADGEEWGTKLAHAKRLKLSIATVARRLKTCRHRYGKNASGARVFFYAFKDIDKACAALLTQMPRAKRDGFFSLSQEIWGTKESIAGVLSVDRSSIEKRAASCRTMKAKDVHGRVQTYYALADVKTACAEEVLKKVPKAGPDGFFKADRELWGTPWAFSRRWNIGQHAVDTRLAVSSGCRTREGKSVNNLRGKYYALRDVRRVCTDLLKKIPRADKNGFFNLGGELWGTAEAIARRLGVSGPSVALRIDKCRSRKGKPFRGQARVYYPLSDVRKACADLLNKKRPKNPVTKSTLIEYASVMAKVLKVVRKAHPDIKSDDLWQAITTRWTEAQFLRAVTSFKGNGRTTSFAKLLR